MPFIINRWYLIDLGSTHFTVKIIRIDGDTLHVEFPNINKILSRSTLIANRNFMMININKIVIAIEVQENSVIEE